MVMAAGCGGGIIALQRDIGAICKEGTARMHGLRAVTYRHFAATAGRKKTGEAKHNACPYKGKAIDTGKSVHEAVLLRLWIGVAKSGT
jgi:hypothetical protein